MPTKNTPVQPNLSLPGSWQRVMSPSLSASLVRARTHEFAARERGNSVYPPEDAVLRALELTPFEKVRVVILGQDPYHGPRQAHGLSFSVPHGVPFPPSLRNIFKERASDLALPIPASGDLSPWAKRGLLLLNAVLTVEDGKAGSHAQVGWEEFTDGLIHAVSLHRESVAFVLWGSYAQKKKSLIDQSKHFVLESAHPSPLSAYRGFFGSKPFSRINDYFTEKSIEIFDWDLP